MEKLRKLCFLYYAHQNGLSTSPVRVQPNNPLVQMPQIVTLNNSAQVILERDSGRCVTEELQ